MAGALLTLGGLAAAGRLEPKLGQVRVGYEVQLDQGGATVQVREEQAPRLVRVWRDGVTGESVEVGERIEAEAGSCVGVSAAAGLDRWVGAPQRLGAGEEGLASIRVEVQGGIAGSEGALTLHGAEPPRALLPGRAVQVEAGRYYVQLAQAGFEPVLQPVRLSAGSDEVVTLEARDDKRPWHPVTLELELEDIDAAAIELVSREPLTILRGWSGLPFQVPEGTYELAAFPPPVGSQRLDLGQLVVDRAVDRTLRAEDIAPGTVEVRLMAQDAARGEVALAPEQAPTLRFIDTVDGTVVQAGGLSAELPAGAWQVEVPAFELGGSTYGPTSATFTVASGLVRRIELTARATGQAPSTAIDLGLVPLPLSQLTVSIDGSPITGSPVQVEPGWHAVRVEGPALAYSPAGDLLDFNPAAAYFYEKRLQVPDGQVVRPDFPEAPNYAVLEVTVDRNTGMDLDLAEAALTIPHEPQPSAEHGLPAGPILKRAWLAYPDVADERIPPPAGFTGPTLSLDTSAGNVTLADMTGWTAQPDLVAAAMAGSWTGLLDTTSVIFQLEARGSSLGGNVVYGEPFDQESIRSEAVSGEVESPNQARLLVQGQLGVAYLLRLGPGGLKVTTPDSIELGWTTFVRSLVQEELGVDPRPGEAIVVTPETLGDVRIYFEEDSTRATPESLSTLRAVAEVMRENPEIMLRVDGHADSSETAEQNRVLSTLLAEQVEAALMSLGVEAPRLTVLGRGDEVRVAPPGSPENTRVQFDVTFLEVESLSPVPLPEEFEIRDKVYFSEGSATLRPETYELLNEIAAVLQAYPFLTSVEVAGHTDDLGASYANQALSEQMARAVRSYLVAQGVAAERLIARGYGEDRPIASNSTEAGRAQNRRVEFIVLESSTDAGTAPAPD